jgi:hypothetical protein
VGELEESFAQLLGRQPTDHERQRLYRVRDALRIKATDAVWLLFMVLEHYETLYERVPSRIADAARDATKTVRETAEAQAKAARDETKRALAKAIADAVDATAKQRVRADVLKWVSVAVSIVAILFVAVGWGENRRGQAHGAAAAENQAKAACAYVEKMSSWALTPDGIRARELDKLDSLHDLVNCAGRGLERKGAWCVAQGERGKPCRWRLPDGEREP